jgi:hypothetical protein
MIRELCMVNFRAEFIRVDGLLDQSAPQPRVEVTMAEFEVQRANHYATRRALLVEGVLGYPDVLPDEYHDLGIASKDWPQRYSSLKSMWLLMNTWPRTKPLIWRRGMDLDASVLSSTDRDEWERMLVRFYVQSVFDLLKHVPSLPRCLT